MPTPRRTKEKIEISESGLIVAPAVFQGRPVVHPEPWSEQRLKDNPITHEDAIKFMGWTTQPAGEDWGKDFLCRDERNNKVRCTRNLRNRQYDHGHARKISQDHLTRSWRFNFENLIIGWTDQVVSGQHRFGGLILAFQRWESGPESAYWRKYWPKGPPVMYSSIGYGCPEDDETIRTLDNVKPRSLTDVLWSEGKVFAAAGANEKAKMTQMLDFAVRLLWMRTGMKDNQFHEVRTHSEALDFIDRHRRILKAVEEIYKIYKAGPWKAAIQRLTPGYAAGLFYLMACSASDGEKYRDSLPRSETKLNFQRWDRAAQFWQALNRGVEGELHEVARAFARLADGGKREERMSILCKAWQSWAQGRPPTAEQVQLKYVPNKFGISKLVGGDGVGGIDQSDAKEEVAPPLNRIDLPGAVATAAAEEERARALEENPEEYERAKEEAKKAALEAEEAAENRRIKREHLLAQREQRAAQEADPSPNGEAQGGEGKAEARKPGKRRQGVRGKPAYGEGLDPTVYAQEVVGEDPLGELPLGEE